MTDLDKSLAISAAGMNAQAARMRLMSENIANADTPGYHRKLMPFTAITDSATGAAIVAPGKITLDSRDPAKIFEPSHPMADTDGYYQGSNVELVLEIADAREAQRSYEANLKMLDQARQMTNSLLDLIKR